MTLCGSWLRESTASPSLRDFWMNSLNALYAPVATRRAQKFPSAASLIRYPDTVGCQGHRRPRVSATSITRNLLMICSGVYFLCAISPLYSLRFQISSSRVRSVLGGWSPRRKGYRSRCLETSLSGEYQQAHFIKLAFRVDLREPKG